MDSILKSYNLFDRYKEDIENITYTDLILTKLYIFLVLCIVIFIIVYNVNYEIDQYSFGVIIEKFFVRIFILKELLKFKLKIVANVINISMYSSNKIKHYVEEELEDIRSPPTTTQLEKKKFNNNIKI
tara:strand:+ start:699 stop:1082 length:384 start_codon:yes stop_codon:yes gene_type:complete